MEQIEIIDNPMDPFYSEKLSEFIRLLLVGNRSLTGFELEEERKRLWTFLDDNKEKFHYIHVQVPVRKNTILNKIPGHVAFEILGKCYTQIKKGSYITETRIETFIEESFRDNHMEVAKYYLIQNY